MVREVTAATTLSAAPPCADGYSGPHAVFVAGLPGAGKSTLVPRLFAAQQLPRGDFAVVDADALRAFHAQFAEVSARAERYEDEMAWFMAGSGFEDVVFRRPDGLMAALFRERRSFVQLSLVNSAEALRWVRYVVRQGYRAHLLLVHAPAEVAAARAVARAAESGRWCAAERVRACEPGLLQWSRDVARAALASGGDARVLDNSVATTAAVGSPSCWESPVSHVLLERYGMTAALLSGPRVMAYAAQVLARLPPELFRGASACLAGGAFKRLLLGGGDAATAGMQRDLDVWPATPADEALLLDRLRAACSSCEATRWNHRFAVPAIAAGGREGCSASIMVELVRSTPGRSGALDAILARFDIALSAIGVTLEDGAVTGCQVHPLALDSVEQRAPLLLPGLPNEPFLLATAERVLRYARELGFAPPAAQLAELKRAFDSDTSPERRRQLLGNYAATSISARDRATVLEDFAILPAEFSAAVAAAGAVAAS